MEIPVLVSVMSVLTVVAIYFWWARKPATQTEAKP
jgi:hypothetical protein